MSKLWKYRNLLGLTDVRRMTGAGWRFCEGGVRTFDAWAVWAAEPEGDMKLVWLADPEIYPDAWPDEQLHQEQSPQLELFAVVIAAGDAITTRRGHTPPPGGRNLFGSENDAGSAKEPCSCVHQIFED